MEESEIYISEMKVLKSQMKVVPSFHHRALRRLQEVSRANSHTLPKAFRVRRRRERLRERERESAFSLCRYPFTEIIIFRVLSKHGYQTVTLAIVKISSRLLSDKPRCEVSTD